MPKVTDEPADAQFGQRFRRAWGNSGLNAINQSQLSERFGYSKQGMSFIVNGYRYPHLSTGIKIAKEFNVCLDWLYTGRDPMRPGSPDPYLRLAYKLMPLQETKLKLIDLFIGLVVDNRISSDDMICWLVDQYGIEMVKERNEIAAKEKELEEIRLGAREPA